MSDTTNIIVAEYMGIAIGLGQLLTIMTQLLKNTDKIPYLNKIPGVQQLTNVIVSGNPMQIRTFVAVLAVFINFAAAYLTTGEVLATSTLMSTLMTYLSALGGYDIFFSGQKKSE